MGSQQQMQSLQLQTGEAGALFSQWMKSSNLLYLLVPADSRETCGHVPVPQKWEVGNIPNTLLALESSLANCSILHWGWLYALYTKLCRLCQYVRLWILFTKHLCISVICLSTCYEACHIILTSFLFTFIILTIQYIFQKQNPNTIYLLLHAQHGTTHSDKVKLFHENIDSRLVVDREGGIGGGQEWEVGVSRCKLLHIERKNNKVPLYRTGNWIPYPMINHNGKEYL